MDRREFLAAAAAPLVLGVVPPAFARRRAAFRSRSSPPTSSRASSRSSFQAGAIYRRLADAEPTRGASNRSASGAAIVAHTELGRRVAGRPRARGSARSGAFEAPRYTAVSDGPALRLRHRLGPSGGGGRRPASPPGRRRDARRRAGAALALDVLGRRLWVVLGSKSAEIAIVGLDHPRGPRVVEPHPATVPRARVGYTARRARLGDLRRPPPDRDLRRPRHAARPHAAWRCASATRDVPRRSRVRHER